MGSLQVVVPLELRRGQNKEKTHGGCQTDINNRAIQSYKSVHRKI